MLLISNPTTVANEINTIHSLFENGLALFHLRKPDFSILEMKAFVNAIGLEFRSQLVLHSHHQLADELGINRLHFTTKDRVRNNPVRVISTATHSTEKNRANPVRVPNPDRVISTATHSIEEFNGLESCFEYAFLSPVYPSISKENYFSEKNLLDEIKKRTNFQTKIIALGGISAANALKTIENGFDDFALLGTIWNSKTPIENFKLCQQIGLK